MRIFRVQDQKEWEVQKGRPSRESIKVVATYGETFEFMAPQGQ